MRHADDRCDDDRDDRTLPSRERLRDALGVADQDHEGWV